MVAYGSNERLDICSHINDFRVWIFGSRRAKIAIDGSTIEH
jgi:hypothetical protein